MNIYLILFLRILHIVAGVLWVGGAAVNFLFVTPSVKATAPESGKFMQHLMGRRNFGAFMGLTSGLTVLAGALLYWNTSSGFQWTWIKSGPGIVFSIGAVIGVAIFLWGNLLIKPRADRMMALSREMSAAGGPPAPQQLAELHKIDGEMSFIERVDFVMLAVALIAMASARYWTF